MNDKLAYPSKDRYKTCGMKTSLLFILVTFSSSLFAASPPEMSPTSRAVAIASQSKRVNELHRALSAEVVKIGGGYGAVKRDAEALLRGTFTFKIAERKKDEEAILRELKSELGDKAFQPGDDGALFPSGETTPFLAAAGSSSSGHHVYPGGLVYHTYSVLKMALALCDVYEKAYGIKIDRDLVRLAALFHDSAKTWTLHWKADGTCSKSEGSIAGTGAHHIWGVAEAIYRGYPTALVVAIAGAHDALMEGNEGYDKVVGYLRAAAILAGKSPESAGLKKTAKGWELATVPPLAPRINHLGDADWIITVPAMQSARALLEKSLSGKVAPEELGWEIDRKLAESGELPFYSH